MNEIILNAAGNTYIGALASRFAYGALKLPAIFKLDAAPFHVFEVAPEGVIHRASQSTRGLAEKYMADNRVLVHREAGK